MTACGTEGEQEQSQMSLEDFPKRQVEFTSKIIKKISKYLVSEPEFWDA